MSNMVKIPLFPLGIWYTRAYMADKKKTAKNTEKKAISGKEQGYSAKDITVLEGLEPVRRRPGMYIGTTGKDGLHHLVWEAFDNSRDEAMGGFANEVEITLLPNDTVRVADNGRGIPVDTHPKTGISALETIMTTLHAGGKFGDSGYKVSGGLHGVGISVVNALSTQAQAIVHRDGDISTQLYKEGGKPAGKVKKLGKTEHTGTVVVFSPDPAIFKEINFNEKAFDREHIINHVRDQAYLVKGLRIRVVDARETKASIPEDAIFAAQYIPEAPSFSMYYDGGIRSFVSHHNNNQKPIHDTIFYAEKQVGDTEVEVALQYVDDISSRIFAFGNNIRNPEGGTHVTGFKTALTKTINKYAKDKKLFKENDTFSGDDVLEGITAVISVKLPEIQFEGQTKAKLGSVEARSAVEAAFGDAFATFLEENPPTAKGIIAKVSLAYQARKAARLAKDSVLRKGVLEGLNLPGKLADCQVKDPEEAELFIVEGESAGGTAKQGRDRRTQAILSLRGKILNVERTRIDRIISSEEIKNIVLALGTAIGDTFNLEKLRYGKIIIATDADVDGAHIRTLLLTLFYRHFKPLIENGNIFFAQPPLYKVSRGKNIQYAYSDEERDAIIKEFEKIKSSAKDKEEENKEEEAEGEPEKKKAKVFVQRYKGLGEMNYDELRDTTMDKTNRILHRVTIKDAEAANETFDILMGSEVPPRKSFIQENAKFANLDI